jgi:cytochrome c oxidase subunit 2
VNHYHLGVRNHPRLVATLVVAPLLVFVAGCSASQLPRLGLPEPVTDNGHRTLALWQSSWVAALIVGAFVWGLIVWAVIFHRRRGNRIPAQTKYNLPVEILYTIVPFLIVAVLFYFTARDESVITKISPKGSAVHVIHVNGIRWSWQFTYEDLPANTVVTGTPEYIPTLYLPEGERVRFDLTTSDVNHSFWVPAFLMKMDLIAGRTNQFEVTPDKLGTYVGRCAELCGRDHSRMLFKVKVVPPAQYNQIVNSLKGSAA